MAHKKPLDPLLGRLVELVFASPEHVTVWLARMGLEVVAQEGPALVVHNPYLHVQAGLLWNSDPVSRAVSLGFALYGAYWPFVCPGLLEAVNEQWQKEGAAILPARGEPPANSHAGSGQSGRLRPG